MYTKFYVYKSLQPGHIRLLRIEPWDESDSSAENELLHISLKEHPLVGADFDALSYTWGPSTLEEEEDDAAQIFTAVRQCYPIASPDGIILVTKSLRNALLRVRDFQKPDTTPGIDRPRYLWADGVCINQEDQAEKSQQVAMMAKLYETANFVLSYVGEADDRALNGLQLALQLTEIGHATYGDADDSDSLKLLNISDLADHEFWARFGLQIPSTRQWSDWAMFFSRSFFARTWILQESILGSKHENENILILCGYVTVPMRDVIATLEKSNDIDRTYRLYSNYLGIRYEGYGNHPYVWVRKSAWPQAYVSLYMAKVHLLPFTYCSDPRDKVYGTLGFVSEWQESDTGRQVLTIDYSLPVSELYCRATKHAIHKNMNLDMLSTVGYTIQQEVDHDLPSWCPEYDSSTTIPDPLMPEHGGSDTDFSAAGESHYRIPGSWNSTSHRKLKVKGCCIDVVRGNSSRESSVAFSEYMVEVLQLLLEFVEEVQDWNTDTNSWPMDTFKNTVMKHGYSNKENTEDDTTVTADIFRLILLARIRRDIWKNTDGLPFCRPGSVLEPPILRMADLIETINAVNDSSIQYLPDADALRNEWQMRKDSNGDFDRFEGVDPTLLGAPSQAERRAPLQRDQLMRSHRYLDRLLATCLCRRFFLTEGFTLGMGPSGLKARDQIWLLAGSKVPFVLRPRLDRTFELIGEAYVDGIMFGEQWPTDEDESNDYGDEITLT